MKQTVRHGGALGRCAAQACNPAAACRHRFACCLFKSFHCPAADCEVARAGRPPARAAAGAAAAARGLAVCGTQRLAHCHHRSHRGSDGLTGQPRPAAAGQRRHVGWALHRAAAPPAALPERSGGRAAERPLAGAHALAGTPAGGGGGSAGTGLKEPASLCPGARLCVHVCMHASHQSGPQCRMARAWHDGSPLWHACWPPTWRQVKAGALAASWNQAALPVRPAYMARTACLSA